MKKSFGFYFLIWVILLAAFNAVVFLVRPLIPGFEFNYDARFWIAWAFILVAFCCNLICARIAFRAENLEKMFLNLPLITVSWSALIAMIVAGAILMLIPGCPAWIAAVVCILIAGFNAITIVKAAWAAGTVNEVDEKVKTQTSFIRMTTVDADSLVAHAKGEEAKAACKKVYEALRYSDPMSNSALILIEAEIKIKMGELTAAVETNDTEMVKEIAEKVVLLAGDRNKKCKALKG